MAKQSTETQAVVSASFDLIVGVLTAGLHLFRFIMNFGLHFLSLPRYIDGYQ